MGRPKSEPPQDKMFTIRYSVRSVAEIHAAGKLKGIDGTSFARLQIAAGVREMRTQHPEEFERVLQEEIKRLQVENPPSTGANKKKKEAAKPAKGDHRAAASKSRSRKKSSR